jgi:anti-sigma B factor antagonist
LESPGGWVVTGEIDAGTCGSLAAAFADLAPESGRPIEVDLGGVSFIDSSGLRVLLDLAQRVAATGGTVEIRNSSRPVARLLAITHLEATFGMEPGDWSTE